MSGDQLRPGSSCNLSEVDASAKKHATVNCKPHFEIQKKKYKFVSGRIFQPRYHKNEKKTSPFNSPKPFYFLELLQALNLGIFMTGKKIVTSKSFGFFKTTWKMLIFV